MHCILKFIFRIELYMFGIGILVPLASIQHNLYDIYLLLCIQYLTSDDGHKTCPKYLEFYSKNKFKKFVHLFGFIIRIYHDAHSFDCQNRIMHSGIINTTILVLCRSDMFQPQRAILEYDWYLLSHSKIIKICTRCKVHCSEQRVSSCAAASWLHVVGCVWNVMAHAQKPDFFFRRNERVRLNRQGRQFSRLLAAEVCASAVDTPCFEVVGIVLATHSIRQFPPHFPSRKSPCAITF